MTLCDAGPMIALIDRRDAYHSRCAAALADLPRGGLLTTWACLSEAMYILGGAGGWMFQDALWEYFDHGVLRLHVPSPGEWERARSLMRDYSDAPMDLADASLVAASSGSASGPALASASRAARTRNAPTTAATTIASAFAPWMRPRYGTSVIE